MSGKGKHPQTGVRFEAADGVPYWIGADGAPHPYPLDRDGEPKALPWRHLTTRGAVVVTPAKSQQKIGGYR